MFKRKIALLLASVLIVSIGCSNGNPRDPVSDIAHSNNADQESSTVQESRPSQKSNDDGVGENKPAIKITTTIFPVYDFTRAVVGDDSNIRLIVQPGASIHSFDPSPADIRLIGDADVFIQIGGGLDAWADRLLSSIDTSSKTVLRLSAHVTMLREEVVEGMESDHDHDDHNDHSHDHDDGHAHDDDHDAPDIEYDEHIWTSPNNVILMVRAIADTLSGLDPANAERYHSNAESYITELQALDAEFSAVVSTAARNKIVVADKFPFQYLVHEYGLAYCAAFPGCSDQTDASVATIAHIVNTVQDENIAFVYHVELSSQNVARLVSEQTGAELLMLHSIQNVSKEEFDAGETYLSLMRHNVESLAKGLS